MRIVRLSFTITLAVISVLGTVLTAHATITIDPGEYEINALLHSEKKGVVAVFNPRTSSELRVKLTGPLAKQLKFKGVKVLHLKLRFKEVSRHRNASAELIEYRELKPSEEASVWISNDFAPMSE